MRCKKHPADLSSSVGVCASCLHERLVAIIQAQKQAQLQQALHDYRKSESQEKPAPPSFPGSVSPYISRRKSDTTSATRFVGGENRRFHSTPLVGPIGTVSGEVKKKRRSNGGGKFSSLFFGLFRSKSDKSGPSSGPSSGPISDPGVGSCTASPSWFSGSISGPREKQIRTFSLDESAIRGQRKACRNRDRGMSPDRHSDDDDGGHYPGGSSERSPESSPGWRQNPRTTPSRMRRGGGRGAGFGRNVSGLTFCLSPLVRASPNRHWNQKGMPPEMVAAGESRVQKEPHLFTTASFCKNRSRKLADFGRYNYNTNH